MGKSWMGEATGGAMLTNLLYPAFYLFIGLFLAFSAQTGLIQAPKIFLWLAAGAFLLIAAWRFLHIFKGSY
jgi:hypothetical protein